MWIVETEYWTLSTGHFLLDTPSDVPRKDESQAKHRSLAFYDRPLEAKHRPFLLVESPLRSQASSLPTRRIAP